MSASREKKQRQGAGPDQKAVKAQQEQAARKRTTIIYSVIAAVIAVLVIALLVWRSGFFQARASAATVGDETLTTAELCFYYYDTRAYYASLGILDTSKADDSQFYNQADNKTYRDFFLEQALENAQQYKVLSEQAKADGHTEDEVKDTVSAAVDALKEQASSSGLSYSAYLKARFGPYVTADVFEKLYTRIQMGALADNNKYTELFDGYSQSDLDAYYKDNADSLDTIEYSYLYFAVPSVDTKDADGNDLPEDEVNKLKEEAKAEAKEKAEEALEAVEGGASFESQASKYELTAASSHADHTKAVGASAINSSFSEHLLHLDKDECELVETDNGCYVISLHDRYLEDEPTRDVRHILARAESTTEEHEDHTHEEAPTDEAWAAAKEKIDAIEAEWNAAQDKSEDAFSTLVGEKSDDSSNLLERIPRDNSGLAPEIVEWTFGDHQPGDIGVVQHSAADTDSNKYWGYHLVYYVGENEPLWMGAVRSALAGEARQAWMDELTEGCPTALTGGAEYIGK